LNTIAPAALLLLSALRATSEFASGENHDLASESLMLAFTF
jgi:hypothetical protein